MARLDLRPDVLDLLLYAGDGISFRMICTDNDRNPIDVSGTVGAQIRLHKEDPDPPLESFSVNTVDAYQGIIYLSLTGTQTRNLLTHGDGSTFDGWWDVQWTKAGAQPRTLAVGKVECVIDVTR